MVQEMSSRFVVKQLDQEDAEDVFALCRTNEIFYQFHPPFATRESILEDMAALPQGKEPKDKYYLGFYDHRRLAAVMDLILDYPQKGTAYIGFFMVDRDYQGRGVGSEIIRDCGACLAGNGYSRLRLAIDQGNPQSEAFWTKNGLVKTGEEILRVGRAYLPMEKLLKAEGTKE